MVWKTSRLLSASPSTSRSVDRSYVFQKVASVTGSMEGPGTGGSNVTSGSFSSLIRLARTRTAISPISLLLSSALLLIMRPACV